MLMGQMTEVVGVIVVVGVTVVVRVLIVLVLVLVVVGVIVVVGVTVVVVGVIVLVLMLVIVLVLVLLLLMLLMLLDDLKIRTVKTPEDMLIAEPEVDEDCVAATEESDCKTLEMLDMNAADVLRMGQMFSAKKMNDKMFMFARYVM